MTDTGTTGIQVAPAVPTEDEMSHVQDILKRAINAIVGMSQLQADVDMLRTTVQSLTTDTERLRQQNAGLDEALYQSRQARQALETDLSNARHELRTIAADRDEQLRLANAYNTDLMATKVELTKAKAERDDYGFHVIVLEEEVHSLSAKLDAIRESHRSIFGDEPKTAMQATPEPPKPVPELVHASAEVTPASDWTHPDTPFIPIVEAPKPIEPEVKPRRYLSEWAPGASWDEEKLQYYVDA